jgi:hypothetical protein
VSTVLAVACLHVRGRAESSFASGDPTLVSATSAQIQWVFKKTIAPSEYPGQGSLGMRRMLLSAGFALLDTPDTGEKIHYF